MPPLRLWGDFQFVKRTIVLVFGKEKLEEKTKKSKAQSLEHKESRISERVRVYQGGNSDEQYRQSGTGIGNGIHRER